MPSQKKLAQLLLLAGVFLLGLATAEARASILFFRPSGTQVDGDEIRDIVTAPGERVQFRIFLQTSGLLQTLHALNYQMGYDPKELLFEPSATGLDVDNRFTTDDLVPDSANGKLNFKHEGATIGGNEGVFLDRVQFNVLAGLKNDNNPDFEFRFVLPDGEPVDARFPDEFSADQMGIKAVEVQPAGAIPEPATGTLLSLGILGFGFFAKRNLPNPRG